MGAEEAEPVERNEVQPDNAPNPKKRKSSKQVVLTHFTVRNPDWSYLTLKLITPGSLSASVRADPTAPRQTLDEVTVYLHLQSALKRFLGLYGTTIPLDILKLEGNDVLVRTARQDASAVVAALGGWVGNGGEGWRVVDWGCWGPKGGHGRDLFDNP